MKHTLELHTRSTVAGMDSHRGAWFAALILALMAGCSGQANTYLVHGMVVYPDGKPLTRGTVEFEATHEGRQITASAEIAPDGTFQLGTFAPNDGAVAGHHRVAVIADFEIATGWERPDMVPPPALHPRYRNFGTSGLEFDIKPRTNNILVEVDYAPPEEKDDDGASSEEPTSEEPTSDEPTSDDPGE